MLWWTKRQLRSSFPDVRLRAAERLGESNQPGAVEPLVAALRDPSEAVRSAVVKALGNLGDARAIEALVATRLNDFSWRVREVAEEVLGQIRDPRGVRGLADALAAVLKSDDIQVRPLAAAKLVKIGSPAVPALIKALKEGTGNAWSEARSALSKIGVPEVPTLVAALNDKDRDMRCGTVRALGLTGDSQAVKPLIGALKDPDQDVRRAAADVLGEIGDAQAVEPLLAVLKDADRHVRREAVVALRRLGDPRAVEPLGAALSDEDEEVRRSAAHALRDIGDRRCVEALVAALRNEDRFVRQKSAKALESLGWKPTDEEEEALLAVALEQWESLESLGAIAAGPLAAALRGTWWGVRRAAATTLAKIGSPGVEVLLAALSAEDPSVRDAAAKALGRIGEARAVQPLVAMLADGSSEVRRFASVVLRWLHWAPTDKRQKGLYAKAFSEYLEGIDPFCPVCTYCGGLLGGPELVKPRTRGAVTITGLQDGLDAILAGRPLPGTDDLDLFRGSVCVACAAVLCTDCLGQHVERCALCGGETKPAYRGYLQQLHEAKIVVT